MLIPHPNGLTTESGSRSLGGYLSELNCIQWSAVVHMLAMFIRTLAVAEWVPEAQTAQSNYHPEDLAIPRNSQRHTLIFALFLFYRPYVTDGAHQSVLDLLFYMAHLDTFVTDSSAPSGTVLIPDPNTPATEAGPRYWGVCLSRLDCIQWSAVQLVLTSTVAHIPLWRKSQMPKTHSCTAN